MPHADGAPAVVRVQEAGKRNRDLYVYAISFPAGAEHVYTIADNVYADPIYLPAKQSGRPECKHQCIVKAGTNGANAGAQSEAARRKRKKGKKRRRRKSGGRDGEKWGSRRRGGDGKRLQRGSAGRGGRL